LVQPSRATAEVFAALDLGSNSFHLLLARFERGKLVVIDRLKESVRIGNGLQPDGTLSTATMNEAIAALGRLGERLRKLPPANVRVVGTNTLRAAKNRDVFLVRAEKALGVPINVISGVEEARLIYQGVAHDFTPGSKTRLVVDIGGGSTEFVLGRAKPQQLESLYMGCVSFSKQFFPDGRLTRRNYDRAVLAARGELQGIVSGFGAGNWKEAVGSSGTVRTIERVLDAMGLTRHHVITPEGLDGLAEEVIAARDVELLQLPGLDDERRPVFAGGLAVLHGVFQELGIDAMHVSMYAIREGIIYDLAGQRQRRDTRVETIENMVEQYHVDREQARRVGRLALALFGQVEQQIETDAEQARQLLRWAVDLHEIGLSIAHSAYHKHGAYIVANSDMPGFSRQEQGVLSFLVLNHRRKLKPQPTGYGAAPDWKLIAILRLACLLLRRRAAAAVPRGLTLRLNGQRLRLQLPAGWLDRHPLTREDLVQEKALLAGIGLDLAVQSLPAK
jgi:exopolyphosphatase/guanosine-5'-triphosphate,3'-diphosphate pyrophosphatase